MPEAHHSRGSAASPEPGDVRVAVCGHIGPCMGNGGWKILAVLAASQFVMVLDQAVMNVSISQLVEDFDTEVTTIQAVITFYSLVMAALMIAGGKMGDIWGRRRAFGVGHVIYGLGSLLT